MSPSSRRVHGGLLIWPCACPLAPSAFRPFLRCGTPLLTRPLYHSGSVTPVPPLSEISSRIAPSGERFLIPATETAEHARTLPSPSAMRTRSTPHCSSAASSLRHAAFQERPDCVFNVHLPCFARNGPCGPVHSCPPVISTCLLCIWLTFKYLLNRHEVPSYLKTKQTKLTCIHSLPKCYTLKHQPGTQS